MPWYKPWTWFEDGGDTTLPQEQPQSNIQWHSAPPQNIPTIRVGGTWYDNSQILNRDDIMGRDDILNRDDILGRDDILNRDDILGRDDILNRDDILGRDDKPTMRLLHVMTGVGVATGIAVAAVTTPVFIPQARQSLPLPIATYTYVAPPTYTPFPTITSAPPPIPPANVEELDRCSLFDEDAISYVFLDHQTCGDPLSLYFKIPGGVPGLEFNVEGDDGGWEYAVKIEPYESSNCYLEEDYPERLYCKIDIADEYFSSRQTLSLYVNGCEIPIYSDQYGSLPESACTVIIPTRKPNPEGPTPINSPTCPLTSSIITSDGYYADQLEAAGCTCSCISSTGLSCYDYNCSP